MLKAINKKRTMDNKNAEIELSETDSLLKMENGNHSTNTNNIENSLTNGNDIIENSSNTTFNKIIKFLKNEIKNVCNEERFNNGKELLFMIFGVCMAISCICIILAIIYYLLNGLYDLVFYYDDGIFSYHRITIYKIEDKEKYNYDEKFDSCYKYENLEEKCVYYIKKLKGMVIIDIIILLLFYICLLSGLTSCVIPWRYLESFNLDTKYLMFLMLILLGISINIMAYSLGLLYTNYIYDITKSKLMNGNVYIYGKTIPEYFVGKISDCKNETSALQVCKIPLHIFIRTFNYTVYGFIGSAIFCVIFYCLYEFCRIIGNYIYSLPSKYEEFTKNNNK